MNRLRFILIAPIADLFALMAKTLFLFALSKDEIDYLTSDEFYEEDDDE